MMEFRRAKVISRDRLRERLQEEILWAMSEEQGPHYSLRRLGFVRWDFSGYLVQLGVFIARLDNGDDANMIASEWSAVRNQLEFSLPARLWDRLFGDPSDVVVGC